MKYLIEDTHNGYRLTMLDGKSGKPRHHFDETGGHGPIEHLFAEADRLWDVLRAMRAGGMLTSRNDPPAA